jgi:hypothetical protein
MPRVELIACRNGAVGCFSGLEGVVTRRSHDGGDLWLQAGPITGRSLFHPLRFDRSKYAASACPRHLGKTGFPGHDWYVAEFASSLTDIERDWDGRRGICLKRQR